MKKRILSIILAISIILAGLCQPISAIATSIPTNEEKISNYLTAEDLSPREDEDSHYISALIELDYSIPSSIIENDTFSDEMTSDEVSQEIIRRRDTMRDFFKEKNESVVSDLDLGDFSYAVSWGAPYIEVFFEDFEEYSMKSEELFDAIDNNAEIQKATKK